MDNRTSHRAHVRTKFFCPRCQAPMVKTTAMNGGESTNWYECTRCNTYFNSWRPMEHQASVLEDDHTFIANFGGYGTGKTTTSIEMVEKHILITPNANVLIGAQVMSQYQQTFQRDFEADFPKAFVKAVNTQKSYVDFKNGARLIYRPFNDPDNLRSYNLTMFVILEASEVNPESYIQLKTRLRNMAASVQQVTEDGTTKYNADGVPLTRATWQRGILESNPDVGWVRSEVLYHSGSITRHGDVSDNTKVSEAAADPSMSTHIAATGVNKYLPANFVEQISASKPSWWIARYVHGSFDYAEGLVHPQYIDCVVPHYDINPTWKRVVSCDYGLADENVFLFGAVNEDKGKLVIYKTVVTNNKSVAELADLLKRESADIPLGGMYCTPVIDPKSGTKRDYEKKTLISHFEEYGVHFKPGVINIDARVFRVNTYMASGTLEIMDNNTYLIDQLRDYKFNPKKIGEYSKAQDKPMDGNDHAITALHFMICELPADPKNLIYGAYDAGGNRIDVKKEQQRLLYNWQFGDDSAVNSENREPDQLVVLDW